MQAKDPRLARGRAAEDAASRFLERHGYELIARNVWLCGAELDLVARDGDTIVFVEVRSRSHRRFGSPVETVGFRKIARVARAAHAFLSLRGWSNRASRFDVVGIDWTPSGPRCTLVRSAFESPL
ncbi:MAG: YraN family protein [Thermodesulfobacteriota bacterium]